MEVKMKNKFLSKFGYITAIVCMVIAQVGVPTVLAEEQLKEQPFIELSSETESVEQGEEISILVTHSKEIVEFDVLLNEEEVSQENVQIEELSTTEKQLTLTVDEIGTVELVVQAENVKSNPLEMIVTEKKTSPEEVVEDEETDAEEDSQQEAAVVEDKVENSVKKSLDRGNQTPSLSLKSPDVIASNQLVYLKLTLLASADELTHDGDIFVTIPKEIILNMDELISKTALGDPFYWGDKKYNVDSAGNIVLNIKYDASKITSNEATAYTINVVFQSPLMYIGDVTYLDQTTFDASLLDQSGLSLTASDKSTIVKKEPLILDLFDKWAQMPAYNVGTEKNVAMIDSKRPHHNIFTLPINYSGEQLKNVVISDRLPDETFLIEPANYLPATGDGQMVNNIRILKVTERNAKGVPIAWKYVTQTFANDIVIDRDNKGFTVSLGDLSKSDSYVIEYGINTQSDGFGVAFNQAKMSYNNGKSIDKKVPLAVYNANYESIALSKSVDKETVYAANDSLNYELKVLVRDGAGIPKGTVIGDELPQGLSFDTINSGDTAVFGQPTYNQQTNLLSFTTQKDIHVGETFTISFKVKMKGSFSDGDGIKNRAYLEYYDGSKIYTNTVTTLVQASAELEKTDAATGAALAGAEFELQDENGQRIVANLLTNDQGKLKVDNLDTGNYQFVETKAPTGYQLDKTPVTFTVVAGQSTMVKVSKTNQKIVGSVRLIKTDEHTGATLSGATFDLYLEGDTNPLKEHLVTDEHGEIFVGDLAAGEYYFVETQAPSGYEIDQTPTKFTIEVGEETTVEVKKINQIITGDVLLTKIDETTKETLAGAEFELQDSSGKVLQKDLVTNESGELLVENLRPGDYQFVETKAPAGYELDNTPGTFTIKSGQQEILKVKMHNQIIPGDVLLTKVDEATKEPLAGAEFELQDDSGEVLFTGLLTDENGEIEVVDLRPGDYQFVETDAPEGYELDDTPVTFTIESDQQVICKIKKTNRKLPEEETPDSSTTDSSEPDSSTSDTSNEIVTGPSSDNGQSLPETGESNASIYGYSGLLLLSAVLGLSLAKRKRINQRK